MKTIVIITILLFTACSSMQNTEINAEEKSMKRIDLSQEGYTYVQAQINKDDADCYELFITEDGNKLEFYNKKAVIKELANEYWIKFRRLRRLPKCKEAQPVEVTEIKNVTYE